MKRIMLRVAYDGTAYCGWQIQKNGLSVQEVLNRAASEVTGEEIRTAGASRTDAGVHALGNVAVFDTEARMPGEKYVYALNTHLPEDIKVQESREVPPDFHPRFTTTVKTYEYRILNRHLPDPTRRRDSYFCYYRLDPDIAERNIYFYCKHTRYLTRAVRIFLKESCPQEGSDRRSEGGQ